jgi:hypothetical protein
MAHQRPFTPQDHFDNAKHNEDFADYLIDRVFARNPEYADWAVVALAYAGLHYTKGAILRDHGATVTKHQGYTDQHGVHHDGHEDLVRAHLPAVIVEYLELFQAGHRARYRGTYRMPNDALLEVARLKALLATVKKACNL